MTYVLHLMDCSCLAKCMSCTCKKWPTVCPEMWEYSRVCRLGRGILCSVSVVAM